MLPSCGCSQLSAIVLIGADVQPVDVRRIGERSLELRVLVIAEHTSVGPIFSSICSCGHSTTVTNGNMYSFFAIAFSGILAVDDRRPQIIAAFLLDEPRAELRGHVVDAGFLEVGCRSAAVDAVGLARHRERGQRRLRIFRRQRLRPGRSSRPSPRRSSCRAATPRCRSN